MLWLILSSSSSKCIYSARHLLGRRWRPGRKNVIAERILIEFHKEEEGERKEEEKKN